MKHKQIFFPFNLDDKTSGEDIFQANLTIATGEYFKGFDMMRKIERQLSISKVH